MKISEFLKLYSSIVACRAVTEIGRSIYMYISNNGASLYNVGLTKVHGASSVSFTIRSMMVVRDNDVVFTTSLPEENDTVTIMVMKLQCRCQYNDCDKENS